MTLQPSDDGVKRRYHSPRRDAQAVETKQAIVEAAMALFAVQGFRETTIKQIAEQADVSEQTVYNVFGDKTGLLVEVGMYSMASGDGGEEAAFVEALTNEPDPKKRIEMAAHFSRLQWQEGALELDLMLFGPDVKDPRLVELAEKVLAYKLEVNRVILGILLPDNIRRSDVNLDDVAAFATTVDSAASITGLLKLGWTMDQYENWLVTLLSLFLKPETEA